MMHDDTPNAPITNGYLNLMQMQAHLHLEMLCCIIHYKYAFGVFGCPLLGTPFEDFMNPLRPGIRT